MVMMPFINRSTGAHSIHVDYEAKQFVTQDGKAIKQGDVITLDGTTGEVNH